MKNFYKVCLLLAFVCPACLLQASPVDSLTVSKVAAVFLSQYTDRYEGLACVVKQTAADGSALYYVFNQRNGNGFVIVTADDACSPILGYSPTGVFAPGNVPPQLNKMLFQRASEIRFIKQQKLTASDETKQFWQQLKAFTGAARIAKAQAVAPLLTTTWDQSPYYNALCPTDPKATQADGYRAVTGCVATAMAQLMKYHNHPKTGQGLHSFSHSAYGQLSANFGGTTYNWAGMPSKVLGQNTAVATLMYHCGVSVDMEYDISANGGSSASTSDVVGALKNYFGYSSSTRYVKRETYASESAWIAQLKSELDARRPMQYRGSGSEGGHSFVCDGYDNNNFFHFNWGWGGQSDAYFNINALNPGSLGTGGGSGGFNGGQGAIIGIQPAAAANLSFNLQLNKKLTITPNPVTFGSDIAVTFNIVNKGTASFQGEYAVALFTDTGEFISFIDQPSTNRSLSAGNTYTTDLSFTQRSVYLSEGNYLIAAYYREPAKEWQLLQEAAFSNPVQVPVKGVYSPLKMYSTPLQTSASPIIQNASFSVNCNIINDATTTFEGDLQMNLYKQDGTFVATINTKTGLVLPPNNYYNSPLVFSTAGLNLAVGTYLLLPIYKRKTETSYYVLAAHKDNNGTYPNLIRVVVAAPPLVADQFEPNETEAKAATLPLSFVNNVSRSTTEGANLHVGSDIDYYKLNLPAGYTYEITARVHDSDNAADGKTYTADVLFSYKTGSSAYSEVFDVSVNEANEAIRLTNGTTLMVKVAPYFVGYKGTYLLDMQVTRKAIVLATEEEKAAEQLRVFPNPAAGQVTVQAAAPFRFHTVNVLNVMGQKVMEAGGQQPVDKLMIDLSRQSAGLYYLQIVGETQSVVRKVSIIK